MFAVHYKLRCYTSKLATVKLPAGAPRKVFAKQPQVVIAYLQKAGKRNALDL